MSIQPPLFKPQTEWLPPETFPNLSKYDEIAIDLETKDINLLKKGVKYIFPLPNIKIYSYLRNKLISAKL